MVEKWGDHIILEEEGSTGLTDNEDSDDDDVFEDSQGF